jgi:hypothetical protein
VIVFQGQLHGFFQGDAARSCRFGFLRGKVLAVEDREENAKKCDA